MKHRRKDSLPQGWIGYGERDTGPVSVVVTAGGRLIRATASFDGHLSWILAEDLGSA